MDRLQCGLNRNAHLVQGPRLGVGERSAALAATIALDSRAAVSTELLGERTARVAGHCEPCLPAAISSQSRLQGSCERSRGFGLGGCYEQLPRLFVCLQY